MGGVDAVTRFASFIATIGHAAVYRNNRMSLRFSVRSRKSDDYAIGPHPSLGYCKCSPADCSLSLSLSFSFFQLASIYIDDHFCPSQCQQSRLLIFLFLSSFFFFVLGEEEGLSTSRNDISTLFLNRWGGCM